MMKADVDTDGDGQLDAMSIGMGFTATPIGTSFDGSSTYVGT